MLRTILSSAIALTLTLPAWADDVGKSKTEELIGTFKQVKGLPEEGELSSSDRSGNKRAFASLDALFDFGTLTTTAIAPHKASLTDTQIDRYARLFTEMVRLMAYPNAGSAFGKAEYTVGASTEADGGFDAPVELYWEDQDLELEITFHWRPNNGSQRVVDVSFDGDSLVKDYQAQFGRIINKDGVESFMERLTRKHAEILEKRGGVL